MKKLSSGMTKFYKKAFPTFWFGFLTVFVAVGFTSGAIQAGQWMFLAMPLFMAALGFVIMRNLLWVLVDEVQDLGDALLVKNGDEQERIPLSNVMNVSATMMVNPPHVTLRLVHPGKFGSEITFTPPTRFRFNPFAKHPLVDELIVRVDQARSKRIR